MEYQDHNKNTTKPYDAITSQLNDLITNANINTTFINVQKLVEKIKLGMKDDMTKEQITILMADICASFVTYHPDYSKLAAGLCISNLHSKTKDRYSDVVSILHEHKLVSDKFNAIVQQEKKYIDMMPDYTRDYNYDYFGIKTLERAYLIKHKDQILERPQHMLLRVAIAIHEHNLDLVKETYDLLSLGYFTHASPTLFNCGTNREQCSSCFLLGTDDSLDGILKTIKDCGMISKWAGGIGVHVSNIRARGSLIKGTNGKSDGIIPMLRVYDSVARYCNQGGKRNGSVAVYLEPWHADVAEFLELKKETGSETERARDLFLALWIPDLFMKRCENNEIWSLMCPDECPGLTEVYGEEFEKLYMKYEQEKKYKKQIQAQVLFQKILEAQCESGIPYMTYKDHVNRKSNQMNVGVIKSSNLCAEITEISNKDEYAVCNLASISLPKFVKSNLSYDYKELSEVARVVTRNLNKIIDINYYPTDETRKSNLKNRPIGVGVQGLADVFAMMKLSFDSPDAKIINKKIFEAIYYGCLRESCEQAKLNGSYETFVGSPFSKGQLQFDLWNVVPSTDWDWDSLKKDIMQYGTRNSLLTALMPTASTSQILGNNECFEPFTSNIYTRSTMAGNFMLINKYLINDLIEINMWDNKMKQKIIYYNGSVQKIDEIPQEIKNRYKTAYEIPQKVIVDMSVERGPYIDQSQSMNIFMENISFQKLRSIHFYGWKHGVKTGMYYLRSKPATSAIQFSLDPELVKALQEKDNKIKNLDKLSNQLPTAQKIKPFNSAKQLATTQLTESIEPIESIMPIVCQYRRGMAPEECLVCSG